MRQRSCFLIPVLCGSFVPFALMSITAAQSPSETANIQPGTPVHLQASDFLTAEQRTGPNHKVAQQLTVSRGRLQFRIDTRWGAMPANGRNMVLLRVNELQALQRARELAKEIQVVDGLLSNVGSATRGVGSLLQDPIGSVLRTPQGLQRMIESRIEKENRRAGSLTRRRLARDLGCDPETTNPLLKQTLDRLSQEREIGALAGKIGLSVAVPGLGLLPASTEFRDTLTEHTPHEVNESIRVQLSQWKVSQQSIDALIQGNHWTTMRRLLLVNYLKKLEGVDNRDLLVDLAARTRTEAEVLDAIQIVTLLSELHRTSPAKSIMRSQIPLIELKDGRRVWILSADYIDASAALTSALAILNRSGGNGKRSMLTPAYLTDAARQQIAAAGVDILASHDSLVSPR